MNRKLMNALAAAGFAVAGGVQAATNPGDVGDGSGELFLSVWDKTSETSYHYDLGMTREDFINTYESGGSLTVDLSGDTNLDPFLSAAAGGDNVLFAVAGLQSDYEIAAPAANGSNQQGFLTTTNADISIVSQGNQNSLDQTLQSHKENPKAYNGLLLGRAGTAADYVVDGESVVATSSDYGYYGNGAHSGDKLGHTRNYTPLAPVGESLAFFNHYLADDFVSAETFQFAQVWTLDTDGILRFAPIPIPPAVLLLISGLLGLVGVARRRETGDESHGGLMTA